SATADSYAYTRGRWEKKATCRKAASTAALLDPVGQAANAANFDLDYIIRNQRKVVRRDDAGAGQQHDAVGKCVVAAQPRDQVAQRPRHLRDARGPLEDLLPAALDRQANRDLIQRRHRLSQRDHRAERATAIMDLRLGQVKGVLALDVAGAHVVADGVADQ